MAALRELQPREIVVVGGTSAVDGTALAELRTTGVKVTRVGGDDRYQVAANLYRFLGSYQDLSVVNGRTFADALSAGSHTMSNPAPILLVQPTRLPQATVDVLEEVGGWRIEALGGELAIDDVVLQDLAALTIPKSRIYN